MKIKLQWLTFRLFLLRITAHEHSAQWLQLFWAAVEKILNEYPYICLIQKKVLS